MTWDKTFSRIVMVDDDADTIFLTKKVFQKASCPYAFIGLNAGCELFDYIKDEGLESIDLLLLDIRMPIQNGFDVLAQLNSHPNFLGLCTIMYSASDSPDYKEAAKKLGAHAYVVKPATGQETRACILTVQQTLADHRRVKKTLIAC